MRFIPGKEAAKSFLYLKLKHDKPQEVKTYWNVRRSFLIVAALVLLGFSYLGFSQAVYMTTGFISNHAASYAVGK